MPYLRAPSGARIVGTLETARAIALIHDPTPHPSGGFIVNHKIGEPLAWGERRTAVNAAGQRIFVADDDTLWPEDQLELVAGGPWRPHPTPFHTEEGTRWRLWNEAENRMLPDHDGFRTLAAADAYAAQLNAEAVDV